VTEDTRDPLVTATPEPMRAIGPGSDRDGTTGRFIRGNVAALVTGERSRQFWLAAERERRATRAALLRQRGYASAQDAPPALVAVADGAAQALLVRDGCFNRLVESGGPTTTKDRHRAVLRAWEAASDRALKHLQAIGLETRERDVLDCSIQEWAEREEAREQAESGPSAGTVGAPGTNETTDEG
jgi:hypothetical protein